ncbi:MAG: hypothetical protein Q8P67_22980, partial [archaeon]|nr:hypothetical protein [archaeon]
ARSDGGNAAMSYQGNEEKEKKKEREKEKMELKKDDSLGDRRETNGAGHSHNTRFPMELFPNGMRFGV